MKRKTVKDESTVDYLPHNCFWTCCVKVPWLTADWQSFSWFSIHLIIITMPPSIVSSKLLHSKTAFKTHKYWIWQLQRNWCWKLKNISRHHRSPYEDSFLNSTVCIVWHEPHSFLLEGTIKSCGFPWSISAWTNSNNGSCGRGIFEPHIWQRNPACPAMLRQMIKL